MREGLFAAFAKEPDGTILLMTVAGAVPPGSVGMSELVGGATVVVSSFLQPAITKQQKITSAKYLSSALGDGTFYAIWSPEWLGRAARIYGGIALVLAAWWRWYRGRLGRERAQLDARCREPEPPDAPDPPGGGRGARDAPGP